MMALTLIQLLCCITLYFSILDNLILMLFGKFSLIVKSYDTNPSVGFEPQIMKKSRKLLTYMLILNHIALLFFKLVIMAHIPQNMILLYVPGRLRPYTVTMPLRSTSRVPSTVLAVVRSMAAPCLMAVSTSSSSVALR